MGKDAGALPQTLPEELTQDSAKGNCPKPYQRRCLWTPQGAIAP